MWRDFSFGLSWSLIRLFIGPTSSQDIYFFPLQTICQIISFSSSQQTTATNIVVDRTCSTSIQSCEKQLNPCRIAMRMETEWNEKKLSFAILRRRISRNRLKWLDFVLDSRENDEIHLELNKRDMSLSESQHYYYSQDSWLVRWAEVCCWI